MRVITVDPLVQIGREGHCCVVSTVAGLSIMVHHALQFVRLELTSVPRDELSQVQVYWKVHQSVNFARKVALSVEKEPLQLDAQYLG